MIVYSNILDEADTVSDPKVLCVIFQHMLNNSCYTGVQLITCTECKALINSAVDVQECMTV